MVAANAPASPIVLSVEPQSIVDGEAVPVAVQVSRLVVRIGVVLLEVNGLVDSHDAPPRSPNNEELVVVVVVAEEVEFEPTRVGASGGSAEALILVDKSPLLWLSVLVQGVACELEAVKYDVWCIFSAKSEASVVTGGRSGCAGDVGGENKPAVCCACCSASNCAMCAARA
jgi:hypothetical protein